MRKRLLLSLAVLASLAALVAIGCGWSYCGVAAGLLSAACLACV